MDQSTSTVLPVSQTDKIRPAKGDAATRWRKLLEDQRASGLPVSAFCRQRGIAASSLFAWRRKLTRAGDAAASFSGAETFKPVTVVTQANPRRRDDDDDDDDDDDEADRASPSAAEATIEVWLPRERRLMVRRGFDRQLLLEVIGTLESLA